MFKFDGISQYCNNFEDFIGLFPSILCNFYRFLGILGFSKILGFFQRFLGIFDEVYTKIFRVIYPSNYLKNYIVKTDHARNRVALRWV
jgi:hypothetical protein